MVLPGVEVVGGLQDISRGPELEYPLLAFLVMDGGCKAWRLQGPRCPVGPLVKLQELLLLLFQELLLLDLLDGVSWGLRGPLGELAQGLAIPRWATVRAFVRQMPHLAAIVACCDLAVIGARLGGVVMSSADGAVSVVAHRCGAWWAPCALGAGWIMLQGGGSLLPPMSGPGRPRPAGLYGREKVWVVARWIQVRSVSSL